MNTATSAPPSASNAVVARTSCGMPATLTERAAAPSNSSDLTGIDVGTESARSSSTRSSSPRAGSAIGTSTAIAAVRITRTPNAQRHELNWANRPPAAGPANVPTPHIADTSAEALVHNELGSAVLITAYPKPASRPPARPCTVRPTSWFSRGGAPAHARLPPPNTLRPNRYAHPDPNRVNSECTVVAATTEPTRYTVVTHA